MSQIRKLTFAVLAVCLAFSTFQVAASNRDAFIAAQSVRSVRHERPTVPSQAVFEHSNEGYQLILENDYLEIWFKPEIFRLQVLNKATGYVWGSFTGDNPDDMNRTWTAIGNSIVLLDYFTQEGLRRRTGLLPDSRDSISFNMQGNTVFFSVLFAEQNIGFDFSLTLDQSGMTFEINDDSITENGTSMIASLYFIPFLGAVRPLDGQDGYIFVPDGSGALMRFEESASFLSAFESRIFGLDFGIDSLHTVSDLGANRPNEFATPTQIAHIPIFGMVHGVQDNAWFAVIDQGAEFAAIRAVPSGFQTDYSWVAGEFIYRQQYTQPIGRAGGGIRLTQDPANIINPRITYRFLHGENASYVGMAFAYRDLLEQAGILTRNVTPRDNIEIQLDFLMNDIRRGFLFNHTMAITTPAQVLQILNELQNNQVHNITVQLMGYEHRGGLNGHRINNISLRGHGLSEREMLAFADDILQYASRVNLFRNTMTARENQLNVRNEAAITLSQRHMRLERNSVWLGDIIHIKPHLADANLRRFMDIVSPTPFGIALPNVGQLLYAEHLLGEVTTRTEAMQLITNAFHQKNNHIALYRANSYMFPYANAIFDIPMVSSQYIFFTDTVPFLQLVLRGSIDYFAPYANLSFFSREDMLRKIEYGAYPAFLLTGVQNFDLRNTPMSDLNSTHYIDWIDTIIDMYAEMNYILRQVSGRRFTGREVLAEGFVRMDYEGGISIYVNYLAHEMVSDGLAVPAQSAAVRRG